MESEEVGKAASVTSLKKSLEEEEKKQNREELVFTGHLIMPPGWEKEQSPMTEANETRDGEDDGARSQDGQEEMGSRADLPWSPCHWLVGALI